MRARIKPRPVGGVSEEGEGDAGCTEGSDETQETGQDGESECTYVGHSCKVKVHCWFDGSVTVAYISE